MRCQDVEIGKVYRVRVSGRVVPVWLTDQSYPGWIGKNLFTGRTIRVRSAKRLRGRSVVPSPVELEWYKARGLA